MLNDTQAYSERPIVLIAYGMFILAIPSGGFLALIGAMIAFVKRDDARGTMWESHYRNMITVFWVGVIFSAVMLAMTFSGVMAAVGLALGTAWMDGDWGGWMFGLPLLGAAVPLAILAGMAFGVWYLYRVVRGFLRALDDRAY